MRSVLLLPIACLCMFFSAPSTLCAKDGAPPFADYCKMLQRDIQGEHHGFIAGNKLYYIAGVSGAEWDEHFEWETIGFTHPIFRDGRARGYGIVEDKISGTGHDKWGWDFYRNNKGAKGTVIVNGKEYRYPTPKKMYWRPDRHIMEYAVGGARITEQKFISTTDVLSTIITSDTALTIRFDGESFHIPGNVPTFDGDKPNQKWHVEHNSKVIFNQKDNAFHLAEAGKVLTKIEWKSPVVVGELMYNGLDFVISSDGVITKTNIKKDDTRGNVLFSFELTIPANTPVALTYAVAEEYEDALAASKKVLSGPKSYLDEKTAYINNLLNEEIPYFRTSDELAVKTYYYLWSLYFMYFRDVGEGYLKYPHTQTAINNFMGLHLWDSWAYTQVGSWIADKWKWGHGNILSWQFMVPYKNTVDNFLPDNFGINWQSMNAYMGFVGATEPAWEQYRRSGDKKYLNELYTTLMKPLYWDGGPTSTFGIDLNALNVLQKMASELGMKEDVVHWDSFKDNLKATFKNEWGKAWDYFYGPKNTPWKDIWALVALQSDMMTKEWAEEMVKRHILDTEVGFMSPVGINTRSGDSPPNGIFRCSTISQWLGVDGMFRQDQSYAASLATLNHIKGMTREWGYPVAPEAWEESHLGWGSRYYNWDVALVDTMIQWLAGIDYSIVDDTFTLQPHLPPSWDYINTYVPVVKKGKKSWVKTTTRRTKEDKQYVITGTIANSPFAASTIVLNAENRALMRSSGDIAKTGNNGAVHFKATSAPDSMASLVVSRNTKSAYKTLAYVTPRTKIFHGSTTVSAENLTPGTTLHYTTDGSVPTASSPQFPKEGVRIVDTTPFTFLSIGTNGASYSPFKLSFENTDLQPPAPIDSATLAPGLQWTAYEIPPKTERLPDFSKIKKIGQGSLGAEDLDREVHLSSVMKKINRKEYFALHLHGYIEIEADQVYNFHVSSDDGSRLLIDDTQVIDLNMVSDYDPWFKEGFVGLKKGLHKVDIYYYQAHYRTKLFYEMRPGNKAVRVPVSKELWKRSLK